MGCNKKYRLTVEYEGQDRKIHVMTSKPLTKRQLDKERSRLSLMGHKVTDYVIS